MQSNPLLTSRPPMQETIRRAAKKRGVLLGLVGLLISSLVVLVLKVGGEVELSFRVIFAFQVAILVSFSLLWLIAHCGWDRRFTWDPHFLFLPSLVGVLLLAALLVAAPEMRLLVFGGFFMVLLFWVGIANFVEVVLFTIALTAAYAASIAVVVARGRAVISWGEILGSVLFLAGIGVYAAFVLERARQSRREARQLREELYRLTLIDPLTELPNRRAFNRFAEAEASRLDRHGGDCALAILDLDHFKAVNDEGGHLVGDEVLRRVSELLRRRLRNADLVARLGGEEFGLVLPATRQDEAYGLVDRLRGDVAELDFSDLGLDRAITLSGGVAPYTRGESYLEPWRRADQALYRAKDGGRNRVLVAAPNDALPEAASPADEDALVVTETKR